MNDSQTPLSHYLRLLRRQWWLVALIFVVTVGTAAVFVFTQASVYRATMKIVVAQSGGQSQPDFGSQQLSQTMKTLIESDVVARQVIRNLRLKTTPTELQKKLDVSFRPDSSVLDISYDSTSKVRALTVLDEYRKVFVAVVDETLGVRSRGSILGRQASLPGIVVKVFDPPHLQPDPVAPKPVEDPRLRRGLSAGVGADARIRPREPRRPNSE